MIIIIMGVAGVGKTTIGQLFAQRFHWQFIDADDFHSQASISKMRNGLALDDTDRLPWLNSLQNLLKTYLLEQKNLIIACSALKIEYRNLLAIDQVQVKFVYLQASYDLINQRLQARSNHFMSTQLLQSQIDTLEEPDKAIYIDASLTPDAIVQEIWREISQT